MYACVYLIIIRGSQSIQNLVAIFQNITDQWWSQEPVVKETKIATPTVQGLVAKVKDTVANG